MNKVESILMVWFITAGAAAIANLGKPIDAGGIVLALIFIVAGVLISGLIGIFAKDTDFARTAAAEKTKRRNRVDALLDLLGDDDLEALRRRLSDAVDEGEPVALQDVLAEDGEIRRRGAR